MDKLSANLLSYIYIRLDCPTMVKLCRIKPIPNYVWRCIFFKIVNEPIGSWLDACRILTKNVDEYMVKCEECGWQRVREANRPKICYECCGPLRIDATYIGLERVKKVNNF